MILRNLKRVAADSNVILSAVIGKAALRVFSCPVLELITTQFNFDEVSEYIPRLCNKYELPIEVVWVQLQMLPLKTYDSSFYKSKFREAADFFKSRDLDDAHLAALALIENIPIWSNDNDFEGFSLPVITTAEMLRLLKC